MTYPQDHHSELKVLAELAGISTPPGVLRIILELLALQVSPEDVYTHLKEISLQCQNTEGASSSGDIRHLSTPEKT